MGLLCRAPYSVMLREAEHPKAHDQWLICSASQGLGTESLHAWNPCRPADTLGALFTTFPQVNPWLWVFIIYDFYFCGAGN